MLEGWCLVAKLEPITEPDELEFVEDVARGSGEGRVEERSEARMGRLLKEAKLLAEGVCFEGRVVKIELGRFGEFVPPPDDPERRKSWERRKDRMAYRFTIETNYGTYTDVVVISAHPNSRMFRLARCYDVIRVGDRPSVCVENGKPKLSC